MNRAQGITLRRTLFVPGAIVLMAVLCAAALIATSEPLSPNAPEPIPVMVRIQTVQAEPVQMSVASQGVVAPSIQSELVPEVSGRVVAMSPALVAGGAFQAGEVLLRLDPRDQQANLDRATASLARANAEREHAQFEHQRLTALHGRDLVSRSQLENSQRLERITAAAQTEAEVAVDQAKRDLARTEIKAPFAGLVRSERVDLGQFVSRGSAIATIYAADNTEVRLPLADQQLAFLDLTPGQTGVLPAGQRPRVMLSASYAGRAWQWPAEVVRTEAEIDARSRMVTLVARVKAGSQAPPPVGLFLQAEIQGREADAVVRLPRAALRDGSQVLVLDADNRLHFRRVNILRLQGEEVLLDAGLSSGERVCISPLQTVIEGMKVQPELAAA